ncbi:MAG: 50S ribosomal protein L32 [Oscillatoriales cyanobacterium]|nr:MAG: 50S ribosomal protein L32 [Oscillatoriales cyanobacterium]
MAVPKKKTSNGKRDQRRATWKRKAALRAQQALSLGKSILTGRSTFVFPTKDTEEEAGPRLLPKIAAQDYRPRFEIRSFGVTMRMTQLVRGCPPEP